MQEWIIIALLLVVLVIVLLRRTSALTSGPSTCTACPITTSQYYTVASGCDTGNCPYGSASTGASSDVGVRSCQCTGQTQLNSANECESCSLPVGKGFESLNGCALVDCPGGQFGMRGTVGCSACSKSEQAVPSGYILQGGSDDCSIIRCQTGTRPNSDKTECVEDYVPPPIARPVPGRFQGRQPAACTGYWDDATQCNMPVSCGQRGYHIDTYVVPPGSGACSVANGTERRTRQCDTWPGANPAYGYTYPCI
jgi:hypothetical protein